MRLLPYTLQGRFLLGLVAAMLLMGAVFIFALRIHTKELILSEAREKATLMVAHTEAIQGYVRNTLRPAISAAIPEDAFLIEGMSTSFVTRHILSTLSIDSDSFTYRRVAKNARNPASEVNEQEHGFVKRFQQEPDLARLEQVVRQNGGEYLQIARPVYFSADCMRCHGDPQNAPGALLAMYGEERGFWRHNGELAGVDVISVPLRQSTSAVSESVSMFALWFAGGMVVLLGTVQGFFNRLVVHNLRRVGGILQKNFFSGEGSKEFLEPLHKEEEIEGMVRSIEVMASHLADTRRQLSDHARNLERRVRERTSDLESVLAARSADVQLFVRLLSGLNQSQDKQNLLQTSLELIARHFNASAAIYACGLSGIGYSVWPPEADILGGRPGLRAKLASPALFLLLEKPEPHADYWLLPVQTTGQTRGVLGLFWDERQDQPAGQISLAQAFGRQLGIALDNLEALDALLRQNFLLDSLVEGVPDPLILVEGGVLPLLANSSAKALALRMGEADAGAMPREQEAPSCGDLACIMRLLHALDLQPYLEAEDHLPAPATFEKSLPDGRSFAIGLYPVPSVEPEALRAIIHIREITEEKHLLTNLRRSEKLAVVGQLAAGLAHEINNPLGVIRCYAELLGSSCGGDQEAADIQVILHHVEQAQSVLRDLLDFSRPRPSDAGPCDLESLLTSLAELFKPKASSARVTLRVEPPKSALPLLHTDSGMLEQVLINLLLNALAAVPREKGVITLSACFEQARGTVTLTVSDNGPGIEEAAMAKIFDPFFTTKPAGSGTGLGLTVAFGMVREMGGTLEVSSKRGAQGETGAVFSVTLPVKPVEGQHAD